MKKTATAAAIAALATLSTFEASAQPSRPMNGRFARGAGESVPQIKQAGTKSGDLGTNPYAASYLPMSTGPLAKETDGEMRRKIENGFDGCDLVHQIIKDNAGKDSASKLDTASANRAAEGDGRATAVKERYLRDGYKPDAPSWTGWCQNWAAAGLDPTINFMVSMDKIYADVPFGLGDLRELTTYVLPQTRDYAWFGKRNNSTEAEPAEDNLDPADLLSIFENYVGPGKPGIVMDVDPGQQVWNQPYYKWERTAEQITDPAKFGDKKPPQGGGVYAVRLSATYGVEGNYAYRGDTIDRNSTWNMLVYTDKSGNIVDTAWDKSASNSPIPDFAWAPVGERANSPEFERLKKIAKEGVSVNDIEAFCKAMAALPSGSISAENAKTLRALLDKICPVLDQNKVSDLVRETATRTGQDYSALDAAIRSDVEARG